MIYVFVGVVDDRGMSWTRLTHLKYNIIMIATIRSRISLPYWRFRGKLRQLVKKEVDLRIIIIAVMIALCLSAPCWTDNGFKEGTREIGQGFKEGSKKVGEGIKKMGKEFKKVGQDAKKVGQETGQEAKKTGRSIGKWFRDTGEKTGSSFRELAETSGSFSPGIRGVDIVIYCGFCNTVRDYSLKGNLYLNFKSKTVDL